MKFTAKEVQDAAKYGPETTVLRRLMECFFEEMVAKFWARVAKHPGEASVTNDAYDWKSSDLQDAEHHLITEFIERFPEYWERFPELKETNLTIDGPETEDIDIANLAFYDWACRVMRKTVKN